MTDQLARRIVKRVLRDLDDRSGFDHWWGGIDRSIQKEIVNDLTAVVAAELPEETA